MKRIFLLILLWPFLAVAQQKEHKELLTKDSLTDNKSIFYSLVDNWRFHEGDDSLMAKPGYNDSGWEITDPNMRFSSFPKHKTDTFSSIGWLRYNFIVDTSMTNIPLAFRMSQYGASEIYLDGKKIASYGIIRGKDSTIYYDPQDMPFVFIIPNAGSHLLAVRYANYNARINFERSHRNFAGFRISLSEAKYAINADHWQSTMISLVCALLFGFFIAFCMAHLFLYFFYRASSSNLYFSIFCFCLACVPMIFFLNRFDHNPYVAIFNSFLGFIILSVGCFSFSGFTNHLFSVKKIRFKIVSMACVLALILLMINGSTGFVLYAALVLFVFIEATIITIRAIFKKIKGAGIIGAGILFFTLFFLSNILFGIVHGSDTIREETIWGKIYLVLLVFAIICLPIFMSLYLAWEFAFVNKTLKQQLQQVELLSAQTIAQEQEKKHLLEGQKELLETEVANRTTEIVTQKEKIEKQHDELKMEKKKSDELLLNILPVEIADELKEKGSSRARLYDEVTVLFTDFVDFTNAGERMDPEDLVDELHMCFKAFDEIVSKYGIEKIKTIGDAYLAVCGLPEPAASHAAKVAAAALEIVGFMTERKSQLGSKTFEVRVGIHSGSVVAGIVGVKKFAYDIWGDTVNTAARLEQSSEPGKINISQTTYDLLEGKFVCTYRGKIQAKNKGELSMYFIDRPA